VGDELTSACPHPTYFGTSGAEISASLNAFVQAQRNWKLPDSEIVYLPTPSVVDVMTANRNGVGLPPSKPADNDPPFAMDGRLTGTDLIDVGWHLNGAVGAPIGDDGSRDTHFTAEIGADVWMLTLKVNNVIGVNGHIDTHTPAPWGRRSRRRRAAATSASRTSASRRRPYHSFEGGARICKSPRPCG